MKKEKVLLPFWNKSCKEMSQKLLLPTEIDFVDLDLNLYNGYAIKMLQNSWFLTTVNSHLNPSLCKTCFQSSQFSPVVSTDSENTVIRSRKIRLYPTKKQEHKLEQMLGASRYYYNAAVELFNSKGLDLTLSQEEQEKHKPYFVHAISRTKKANDDGISFQVWLMQELADEWNEEIPYKVKQMPLEDAYLAAKLVNARNKTRKVGTGEAVHELHFRSKKKDQGSIYVDNVSVLDGENQWHLNVWSRFIGGSIKFRDSKNTREEIRKGNYKDGHIVKNNDKWFLCLPMEIKCKTVDNQHSFVAVDPGVRTFVTTFDNDTSFKIGTGDFKRIARLAIVYDKLISSKKLEKSKKILWKIQNIRDELHHKTAIFLCKNYRQIVLPDTDISSMVVKAHRKIRSKTARAMLTYAYYKFSQFVISKTEEYNVEIIRTSEAYTSKTCGSCGHIHSKLGGKSVFVCSNCGSKVDRDVQGARNILLRAMVDSPSLQNSLQNYTLTKGC